MAGNFTCHTTGLTPAFDALLDILAAHLVEEFLAEHELSCAAAEELHELEQTL